MAFVQHEFGVVEGVSDENFGTEWINAPEVEDLTREANNNVDYLLIFPHCGVEHVDAPLPGVGGFTPYIRFFYALRLLF